MRKVLSAIIITRNEEENIKDCLDSVKWADEILVIDSGSTDKTILLAEQTKARIFEYKKGSFSDWRNQGAKEAKGEWLLYVDADERVTPKLKKEIKSIVKSPRPCQSKPGTVRNPAKRGGQRSNVKVAAFAIPRKNILLGHEMKYGGWWPDYVLRLIKKDALKGWKGDLHEQPEIDGKIGKLKNPLIHNTHRSLTEMVDKTNNWSEIEAKLMYDANHPKMNIVRFFTAMFREFWYRGIREKGFLDGPIGIIEIFYQVFSRFVSYAKLWEMQLQTQSIRQAQD